VSKRKPWWRRAWKASFRWLALRLTTLAAFLIFLLARTWRIEIRGYAPVGREHDAGRFVIFAFSHGRMLPAVWSHRGLGVRVLISEHFDGELITRIVEAFGFTTARGSATRGGARALLELVREKGGDLAVTPDGPNGPFLSVKPGVTWLASRSGLAILPASIDADRRIELPSWDRFRVPLPGAKVLIVCAPLRRISPDADAAELERERVGLEHELRRCEDAATAAFGRPPAPKPREGAPIEDEESVGEESRDTRPA
jgi:lysophospholipid acyltransferase (LPLAT)-like uncharacterized protein